MAQPMDTSATSEHLDALIGEAFNATQVLPTIDRCRQLNSELRDAIDPLYAATRELADTYPVRSRDWYRLTGLLEAADEALAASLGVGLMSAALHLTALARVAQDLRGAIAGE